MGIISTSMSLPSKALTTDIAGNRLPARLVRRSFADMQGVGELNNVDNTLLSARLVCRSFADMQGVQNCNWYAQWMKCSLRDSCVGLSRTSKVFKTTIDTHSGWNALCATRASVFRGHARCWRLPSIDKVVISWFCVTRVSIFRWVRLSEENKRIHCPFCWAGIVRHRSRDTPPWLLRELPIREQIHPYVDKSYHSGFPFDGH